MKIVSLMIIMMLIVIVPHSIFAESFIMEQATVINKPEEMEFGIDLGYSYDKWTVENVANTEYTKTETSIPVLFRYTHDDSVEGKIVIPYRMLKGTTTGLEENTVKGTGPIVINAKGVLTSESKKEIISTAAIVDVEFATGGGATKSLREGGNLCEGFNVAGSLAVDKKLSDSFIVRINAGYKYKGSYTNVNDAKIVPGSVYFGGLGTELVLYKSKLKKDSSYASVLCELLGTSFGNYKLGDNIQLGTGGSTWDLVPSLRYQTNNLKLKAGVDLSMGEPTYRQYQFKIIAGISYVFK